MKHLLNNRIKPTDLKHAMFGCKHILLLIYLLNKASFAMEDFLKSKNAIGCGPFPGRYTLSGTI